MSNIRVESLQCIKLRGYCFAEITNVFSKDSLQSIKTPSRLTLKILRYTVAFEADLYSRGVLFSFH